MVYKRPTDLNLLSDVPVCCNLLVANIFDEGARPPSPASTLLTAASAARCLPGCCCRCCCLVIGYTQAAQSTLRLAHPLPPFLLTLQAC